MLTDPNLEELLPKTENTYTLAITVAKRTRQLVDGAQPFVAERPEDNLVSVAARELSESKLGSVPGDFEDDLYIPLRPEVQRALEEKIIAQQSAEEETALARAATASKKAEKAAEEGWDTTEETEEDLPMESKIRFLEPDELFLLPEERAELESEEESEHEKISLTALLDDDEDEDEEDEELVTDEAEVEDEEVEDWASEDLEIIDSSIDDILEDEDLDL